MGASPERTHDLQRPAFARRSVPALERQGPCAARRRYAGILLGVRLRVQELWRVFRLRALGKLRRGFRLGEASERGDRITVRCLPRRAVAPEPALWQTQFDV